MLETVWNKIACLQNGKKRQVQPTLQEKKCGKYVIDCFHLKLVIYYPCDFTNLGNI